MVGVMRVDEWGLERSVIVVLVLVLLGFAGLALQQGLGGGLSSTGDVSTIQDSETIDTSRVFNNNGVAILIQVTVLSNSLIVASGLLLESHSVLLSVGCSKFSITHVKPLFLENSCQTWISPC